MEEMLAMIEAAKDDVANVTEEDIDALLLKSPILGDAHALVFYFHISRWSSTKPQYKKKFR